MNLRVLVRILVVAPLPLLAACSSSSPGAGSRAADSGETALPGADAEPTADAGSTGDTGTTGDGGTTGDAGTADGASGGSAVCSALANLQSTAASTSEIDLSWAASSAVTFTLSRKTYCGTDPYQVIAMLPAGASSYADKSVQANWVYWYALTGIDAGGNQATVALAVQAAAGGTAACGTNPGEPSGFQPMCVATAQDAGSAGGDSSTISGEDASPPPPEPDGGAADGGSACPVLAAVGGPAIHVSPGQNIQAAVNGAASGSQIVFASGTYTFSTTLNVPAGITLAGQSGVTFAWSGSSTDPTVQVGGNSVRIDGITFAGRTTSLYGGELSFGYDAIVSNNTFQGGSQTDLFSGGVTGGLIARNTITDAGNIGLLVYGAKNTQVVCNTFVNNNEQLHFFWGASGPNNPDNVSISNNVFEHTHRYVMELQGGPNTLEVAHNWAGDWADADIQGDCMSTTFSIATGGATAADGSNVPSYNVTVHDNVVASPPSGALQAIASGCTVDGIPIASPYELMGSNLAGWNNYEWGGWDGGPLVGFTTPSWSWKNNVKVGSSVSTYPAPIPENGYQAAAAGNYADNSVVSALAMPDSPWAFTNDAP